ncbi:enoyl-CoA hydratase/isomerase family protein [Roseomonas hellenica]|uniref:Enoyl-CoA hydratase/isomerase family protein n=1 Tax=Plastoroseomonas hellenica TaxID=2687306 RepID=A0ABS5EV28_9PROT|nr:enoyl-CoA hydratase/isomerase family protein [Plastoroseomonas hellenica]MBR0663810.1 enoyl-CoA hydratase/isomerase family protein [Plastoroseomonas hellenica]
MSEGLILQEDRGRTRILRLNRPEKRNALNRPLIEALLQALEQAGGDDGIAAILLAANGAVFCAGADLGEMRALREDPVAAEARRALSKALFAVPGWIGKPVVAALQGAALGAGAALALGCDMAVLADEAVLGFPEARHGMLPALMAPVLLRHVPPRRAFELLATGRDIPPAEALALGLVQRVVPAAAVLDEAVTLAEAAALLPPPDLLRLKELLMDGKAAPA